MTLAIIWVVAFLTFVGSQLARRGSPALRLAIASLGFVVISALLIPLVGPPWHPVFVPLAGESATPQRIAVAIWWLLVARLILLGGRISFERQADASRLVFDLASGAVHMSVIFIILSLAFGVFVPGLIATSGVIAIVIGLALQNTLGDLFSGIAISIESSFATGDYIWIEGSIEGVVLETNWRATRIVTDNQDIATIPNSVIAKAKILNRSRPTDVRSDTIRVVLEPGILPQRGIALLRAATLTTVVRPLEPQTAASWKIACTDVRGEGTFYEVRFSALRGSLGKVRSEFLDQIARHARYAGVAFGMQNGLPMSSVEAPDVLQLLRKTRLFSDLQDAEFKSIELEPSMLQGEEGAVLVREGEIKRSFFIVAQGVLEIVVDTEVGPRRLQTVAPGDCIGEQSILADTPSPTTARAMTPYLVYEVKMSSLAAMRSNPSVMKALTAATDDRQKILDLVFRADDTSEGPSGSMLDRVRSLFPF